MLILGGCEFLMGEVPLQAIEVAQSSFPGGTTLPTFRYFICSSPPMDLRYCLTWGLWIIHTPVVQEIVCEVRCVGRSSSSLISSPLWTP